jgi:hypothetical protein
MDAFADLCLGSFPEWELHLRTIPYDIRALDGMH